MIHSDGHCHSGRSCRGAPPNQRRPQGWGFGSLARGAMLKWRASMHYLGDPQGDPDDSCWLSAHLLVRGSPSMRMACRTLGHG